MEIIVISIIIIIIIISGVGFGITGQGHTLTIYFICNTYTLVHSCNDTVSQSCCCRSVHIIIQMQVKSFSYYSHQIMEWGKNTGNLGDFYCGMFIFSSLQLASFCELVPTGTLNSNVHTIPPLKFDVSCEQRLKLLICIYMFHALHIYTHAFTG